MNEGSKKVISICEKCRHLRTVPFATGYGCDLEETSLYYPTVEKLIFETLGPAEGCPYILEHTLLDDKKRRRMDICEGCKAFKTVNEYDDYNEIELFKCSLMDTSMHMDDEYTTLEVPDNCLHKRKYENE